MKQDYYWFYFKLKSVFTADTNTSLVHLCIISAMLISTVPGMLGAEINSPLRLNILREKIEQIKHVKTCKSAVCNV